MSGTEGFGWALAFVAGYFVVWVVTCAIACHLAGKLVGIEFGYLRTALPKLGAAVMVPIGLPALVTVLTGFAVADRLMIWAMYLIVLHWLFDLDKLELAWTLIFTAIIHSVVIFLFGLAMT